MGKKYVFKAPVFTISLDFELMWGVFDKRTIDSYGRNVHGVHSAIPGMLALFKEYGIHVTWAAVGCLYYRTLEELMGDIPAIKPAYVQDKFSAYSHMKTINPADFPVYYSGLELLKQIRNTPGQEIGTHTFSHYYCLEEGQDKNSFQADIRKSVEKAGAFGIDTRSIIFPRNQYNEEYLGICRQEGITAYRGNEKSFIQRPRTQEKLNILIRSVRFADTYINTTGANVYKEIEVREDGLVDIPASFFFRPYGGKSKILEVLKIRRYKKAMLAAARSGSLFHLWWHPHNFGINQEKNLAQLKEILAYYSLLNKKFGMQSLNMAEIAEQATSNL